MSNTQHAKHPAISTTTPDKPSALERFSIGFEYDKTLQDIKRDVRKRTI